jgi:hypothetical protein
MKGSFERGVVKLKGDSLAYYRLSGALFVFAVAALAPLAASAQASPSPSPSPAPMMNPATSASPAPAASGSPSPSPAPTAPPHLFVLQGYGDASYSSLDDSPAARFTTGGPSRVFDTSVGPFFDSNSGRQLESASDFNQTFDLQNANVQLNITDGNLGGKIEGSFGTDADVIASNGQSRSGVNLTQSYLQYAFGPLTLLAGKFETLAGAEVIESPSDTNFTRSYLFGYAVPFTHTGARLTYAYNSKISLVAGLNNGWDDWKFAGKKKTLEGGLLLTPSPGWALTLDTYNGNDFALSGVPPQNVTLADGTATVIPGILPLYTDRRLYDGVLTLHPTGALTVIANYDNGQQLGSGAANGQPAFTAAQWVGIAGYLNYQLNSLYSVSLRKETFNDKEGFRTGIVQRLQSNTATLSYAPGKYIFRAEYRQDISDGNNFTYTGAGLIGSPLGRPDESSLSLEMILKLQ